MDGEASRGEGEVVRGEWVQAGPWAVTGVLRDSSRGLRPQYGLNADHPLTRPRAFQNTLLTPARCRAGQVSLSAHPPGVGNFLSLYHPITTTARPTPYHPSPQAGVPLGGETPTKEKWARSGQEKPHRRGTKKRKGDRLKEAGTSAHGNGARQRTIPPRRGTKEG